HGGQADVALRMEDVGTTDASTGVDPAPGLGAEVGYGPSGTTPGDQWTWFSAAPDETWDDAAAPGEDRWEGSVIGQQSGDWDVAGRVTADDGVTWLICDTDGSDAGYDPELAGTITVGQSACDPNPCVVPPETTCLGTLLQIPVSPGSCAEDEEGEAVCEYAQVSFDCALYDGCDAGVCLAPPSTPWSPGQLVITEVHRDSQLSSPDGGEWIEIYNSSGSDWDLRSCALEDAGGESWVIADPAPVVIADGEFMVLAAASDLGVGVAGFADLVWAGFSLDNLFDEVIITCGGTQIDAISWTPDWPGDEGVAMQLQTSKTNATLNDEADSWCAADTAIGDSGELGTPGEANTPCP
ncbi:MAG: lamin tail domain-containing protein, partial [Myxococcota bacterium]|nr:lamin tail domain-containing protein [Myxococcota bacterium]